MNSPILAIPEIAENQNNKYVTHNNAIAWLEAMANDIYINSTVGAGPINLSASQATKYFVYKVSGASANFNLVFPSQINSNNAKRTFAVRNNNALYKCTVKASTGAGAAIVLNPGEGAIILQSYEDMTLLVPINTYDIACNVFGQPGDGDLVMRFVATRPFKLMDNFAGSVGYVGTNPDASAVFDVRKNGSSIGTVTVGTGGTFTFSTTGSTIETFAVGDRFEVFAPSPADATMADVSLTFLGIAG